MPSLRHVGGGFYPKVVEREVVIVKAPVPAFDVERKTAVDPPAESNTPSAPPFGMSTSASLTMRPVQDFGRRVRRKSYRCRGSRCTALEILRNLGSRIGKALRSAAAVDGQHIIFAGLHVPQGDHLDEFVAILRGDVVIFRKVLVHVIQFPAGSVELGEFGRIDRRAELIRIRRTTCPATGRRPASRRDQWSGARTSRSIACRVCFAASRLSKACAKLWPSIGDCVTPPMEVGRLEAEGLQYRRDHVDRIRVLGSDLAL